MSQGNFMNGQTFHDVIKIKDGNNIDFLIKKYDDLTNKDKQIFIVYSKLMNSVPN